MTTSRVGDLNKSPTIGNLMLTINNVLDINVGLLCGSPHWIKLKNKNEELVSASTTKSP